MSRERIVRSYTAQSVALRSIVHKFLQRFPAWTKPEGELYVQLRSVKDLILRGNLKKKNEKIILENCQSPQRGIIYLDLLNSNCQRLPRWPAQQALGTSGRRKKRAREKETLPRAPVLSFAHYFQAPATQATFSSTSFPTFSPDFFLNLFLDFFLDFFPTSFQLLSPLITHIKGSFILRKAQTGHVSFLAFQLFCSSLKT